MTDSAKITRLIAEMTEAIKAKDPAAVAKVMDQCDDNPTIARLGLEMIIGRLRDIDPSTDCIFACVARPMDDGPENERWGAEAMGFGSPQALAATILSHMRNFARDEPDWPGLQELKAHMEEVLGYDAPTRSHLN